MIQVAQIVCQTAEKPQFFDPEVGAGEGIAPAFGIGCLDQPLQYVQCRRLEAIAEQKLLTARKPLHGRDQPQEKTQVRFQGRAGVARAVGALHGWPPRGFAAHDRSPDANHFPPGGGAPWTPEVRR